MWLTAALLLALLLVSGLLVWQSYRDAVSTAQARAEGGAQIIGAHIKWLSEAAYQALQRIDEALGAQPNMVTAGSVGDLDKAVAALPRDVRAWVFDVNGVTVLTNDTTDAQLRVADTEFFQTLKAGQTWHVSTLINDRFNKRKVFIIGRRLERNGRFVGAAAIVIPADLLSEFWSTLNLGRDSTAGLIRSDGWLVARHPVPEDTINLKNYMLFTKHLAQSPAGSYSASASPADGVSRIVGFYTVPGLPLIAIAGVSKNAVWDRFRAQIGSVAVIAVPAVLGLLACSLWVSVLLRRYEQQRRQLAEALEQNRILFQEMHHRVKNNLQTVVALVQMHGLPGEIKRDLANRIGAMTAVHQQIYMSNRLGSLDLASYIDDLVASLRQSSPENVQVTSTLTPIEVPSDKAVPLGLIINEVMANAFKHAFPAGRPGNIAISLERLAPNKARLQIRDDGVGFDIASASQGMGNRLIQGLSRQIGADYAFERDGGTVFTLTLPI
ncbi:sensor histidine kinase [Rhodoligotrophos defluvii]|uniref:sensor histidine kinase n=1 Tax=Rhodoligotrophos defluvii TaxID=2561934 RepID=UPI0010C9C24E|nr:histidine kinase dimerization/phosphoacceptor domain -containing protein [Rhodoligotrophos defluvii]